MEFDQQKKKKIAKKKKLQKDQRFIECKKRDVVQNKLNLLLKTILL